MWWTTRGGENKQDEQIAALEEAVERHQRDFKVIRLEWEDVYDRITRTMGRLNARIRKSEAVEPPESDEQGTPQAEPHAVTGTHQRLREARRRHNVLPG